MIKIAVVVTYILFRARLTCGVTMGTLCKILIKSWPFPIFALLRMCSKGFTHAPVSQSKTAHTAPVAKSKTLRPLTTTYYRAQKPIFHILYAYEAIFWLSP